MFKKRNVLATDIINEEAAYNEAILRLVSARTRVSEHELIWANGEDNPNFFTLFGKLSELRWMCNNATECMAKKQSGVKKAFRNIFQEEKILEESRKELQNCGSKLTKLQKQAESAKKKNDISKVNSLETELTTQSSRLEELTSSVECQTEKLEIYKIKELKRSLHTQAEGVLTLAGHVQQLYAAYMQLLDLMPDTPPSSKEAGSLSDSTGDCLEQSMSEVVTHVSDLLSLHPPTNGGIDPKRLATGPAPYPPSSSPHCCRRSFVDQIGLDLFRPKSKDDLSPLQPPPPAVKPKKLSQHKHSVYKVDTGSSDEVESVATGRSSASPLPSPISLSQVTGIIVEEKPSPQRPHVDYTQGMYCEIVIPDREEGSPPLLFQNAPTSVPVRRTSSDSPPHDVKHSRNLSLDRKLDQGLFEQTLKHSRPLESTTDSETASAHFSSSEDLEVAVGEVEHAYARVNIRPLSGSAPIRHDSSELGGGYANPMDAVNLPSDVIQKRLSMGPAAALDERVSDLREDKHSSPYQSVEDVRKMRELQNHHRQQLRQSSKNRSHSVSPNTSQLNLQHQQEEEINYYDDNPGYSRPFDALSGGTHMKVSMENLSKKLPFAPLPPAMKRTGSGDRPGKERSARLLHKTNVVGGEAERGSSEDIKNPVAPRGSGHKRSWKTGEVSSSSNGSVTPPPPLPLSERPRVKEQWQLPRQKQHEEIGDIKAYVRSRSAQAFHSELQSAMLRGGVDNIEPPPRGETGRTVSEGAGAMNKMRSKPPVAAWRGKRTNANNRAN